MLPRRDVPTRHAHLLHSGALTRPGALTRSFALLLLAGALLVATPARATQGPPEQILPDTLPINAERLWLSVHPLLGVPQFEGLVGDRVVFDPAPWNARKATRGAVTTPRRGGYFRFPDDVRLEVASQDGAPKLLPRASSSSPSGMTISLWYRVRHSDAKIVLFSAGGAHAAPPAGPGGQKVLATAPAGHGLSEGSLIDVAGVGRWSGRWRAVEVTATTFVLEGAVWQPGGPPYGAVYARGRSWWEPLWSLGSRASAEPWRMALVLDDGVPTVSLRHADRELFGINQATPQTGYAPYIDDYTWHHVVLRVTREHCGGACASIVNLPGAAQPARYALYVDGEWRGEEVALAPLDLDELIVGELDVPGETYAQPNFVGGPNRLRANMDLDDLHVFDAPLSESEIFELHRWGAAGYTQLFPTEPHANAAASASRIAATPVALNPSTLGSDLRALGNFGLMYVARQIYPQVYENEGYTTFAWLRLETLGDDMILGLNAGTSQQLLLSFKGGGLEAVCGSTRVTAPYPRQAYRRFQLIGITHRREVGLSSSRQYTTISQDGHEVMTLEGCAPATENTSLLFNSAADRWLAWAGHFDRALSPAELDALVSPGPRLWNAAEVDATALDDRTDAGLSVVSTGAGRALDGGWFTNDARPASELQSWLQYRTAFPFGIQAPAVGALDPKNGAAPLTVSFQARFPKALDDFTTAPMRVTLAKRGWDLAGLLFTSDFEVAAVCSVFWSAPDRPEGCYLEIIAGQGKGQPGRRFRVDYKLEHSWGAQPAPPYKIAVAWGPERTIPPDPANPTGVPVTRREPLVSIDGRLLNQKHQGFTNLIEDKGQTPALPGTVGGTPAWELGPGRYGVLQRGSAPDGDLLKPPYEVEILDPRVYSYARDDVESLTSKDRGAACAEGGRSFTALAQGGYCGDCLGSHYAAGGTTAATRECRGDVEFTEECAASSECVGGATCWKGRCLTKDQAACQAECGELGRDCAAESGSWRCAGCRGGLTRNANNYANAGDWELACSWQPWVDGGGACSDDLQCRTGWCLPAQSGTTQREVRSGSGTQAVSKSDTWGLYEITCTRHAQTFTPTLHGSAWSIPRTCAYDPATGGGKCQRLGVRTESKTTTAPDGTTVAGVRCLDGPNGQCIPGFEKTYRLLNPQACVAGLKASTQRIEGTCDVNGWNTKKDYTYIADNPRRVAMWEADSAKFTAKTLKLALLGEDADFVPADYARLRAAGAGPLLLEYTLGSREHRALLEARYGAFLPLKLCASDLGPASSAYYSAADANALVCEPKLQDDGATCPPPGTAGTGRAAWEFCKSGYCDERASGTCKAGGREMDQLTGKAGNKSKSGRSAVKFGIVRVDSTKVNVLQNTTFADPNPRYTATVSQRYVPCVLGTRFPPVDIFSMDIVLDRKDPNCGSEKVTARILGYKINAPKMEGAANCSLVSTSVSADANVCFTGPSCTSSPEAALGNLDQALSWSNLMPGFRVCIPADAIGVKLPEKSKTFFEAVVPIRVGIGLTLDPCLGASMGFASNGLPQVEIKPSIGVGVDARAGVGFGDDDGDLFEASAGAKLSLTLANLSFPIRWLFSIDDVKRPNGTTVAGLFDLNLRRKISLELDILSGWMGLYAELTVGPFGLDWEYPIFKWTGIFLSVDLSNKSLAKWRLDFQAAFNAALAAGQAQNVATCNGNDCLQ